MARLTPVQTVIDSDDSSESTTLPFSEVVPVTSMSSPSAPDASNVQGGITLEQLNQGRQVTRMSIDDYRARTQKQRDDLSGNFIEIPTAKTPVPALLIPIWDTLTDEQKLLYAGDPNSQKDLKITQYPSNQRIDENLQARAEQRAQMNQQQQLQNPSREPQPTPQGTPPPKPEVVAPVAAPKPDAARLEGITKQYVDSLYSKFRGTDPKAPETELYKSLKNATDREIIKIRELLYGKTDGGQDNDIGIYDVFRNGKESAETVLKRLNIVQGATIEEKFKYLEDAIEKIKQYKADFGEPKVPTQPATPKPLTPPVTSQSTPEVEPGVVTTNVPVQNSSLTETRNVTFNPADTDDVVARLKAGQELPVRNFGEIKVALNGLRNAGEDQWYAHLQKQAKLRFGQER